MKSRMKMKAIGLLILTAFLASACATYGPPGPSMPAYIGTGKTQAQFNVDDVNCRQMATARVGDPAQVQQQQTASAILGTLLGAAAGAAIGAATGSGEAAGIGAAIGGTVGLGTGLGVGTAQAQSDAARLQQRWDSEFWQCMYASGHMVPGVSAPRTQPAPIPPPPPAPSYAPPSPPPASAPSYGPPPAAAAPPPPAAVPCKPSGKHVKTPQGFVETCD